MLFPAPRRRLESAPQGSVHAHGPIRESFYRMQKLMIQTYYFEDLAVGMRETIRKTVENEDVIGFAELSGDHNPIHLSEHFARKTRFGGRIVHGLYTASLISGVIGMRLPGPGAVYISQTLSFLGPVKIGDVVDVSVEVVELNEKGRRVRLKCECRVGENVVLEGEGVLSVPPNPKSKQPAA
jgi:3-hydroxybutyryl-CoA dehydratase